MKKFTENLSKKNNKYLFVTRGPGETSQARALAKFISKKNKEVVFCLKERKNLFFLAGDKEFKIFLTENPLKLKNVLEKERPNVILFFNSKMWTGFEGFSENPPFEKPPLTLTIDSNWLFNEKKYPHYKIIKWVDKYLVLFPKKIFGLGLKEKGGNFLIPKNILNKIIPVGLIPSYKKPSKKIMEEVRKKYDIKKDEKFIFSYFSGFGAGHRIFAFNNLIDATDKLIKRGYKIKVLYIGQAEDLDQKRLKRSWLLKKEGLLSNEYFLTLASSDLIFQHQGMVTLSQAISAQIPVICNVSILKMEGMPNLHFWEVKPFQKAGVCEMFDKSTPIKKISQKIEELLFSKKIREKMQKNQRLIYEEGEKKAFQIIEKLLEKI